MLGGCIGNGLLRAVGDGARPNNGVTPSDVLKAEQQLALKIARAMDELRIGDAVLFGEVIVTIEHSKAVTVRFERNHKLSFIKPEPEVKAA